MFDVRIVSQKAEPLGGDAETVFAAAAAAFAAVLPELP